MDFEPPEDTAEPEDTAPAWYHPVGSVLDAVFTVTAIVIRETASFYELTWTEQGETYVELLPIHQVNARFPAPLHRLLVSFA